MKVLLLDIDGVLNEAQQPVSDKMLCALGVASCRLPVYFVTGNGYCKAVDIVRWHGFHGMFCNMADEMRDQYGHKVWEDLETPALGALDSWLSECRDEIHTLGCNSIEWRGSRFLNFCPVGRNASVEQRAAHDVSWRSEFIKNMNRFFPEIEICIGGAVSVDIYSKGADKSRAAKYLNDAGHSFIFIGDKTLPGGNDYPIIQYCESNVDKSNQCFTSNGPDNTLELLGQILSGIDNEAIKRTQGAHQKTG